jgi:uncharacterized protein YecA (UPF0149 family)
MLPETDITIDAVNNMSARKPINPCMICEKEEYKHITSGKLRVCPKCKENISTPINVSKEFGRNALCPCGSGEKYKNCCIDLL